MWWHHMITWWATRTTSITSIIWIMFPFIRAMIIASTRIIIVSCNSTANRNSWVLIRMKRSLNNLQENQKVSIKTITWVWVDLSWIRTWTRWRHTLIIILCNNHLCTKIRLISSSITIKKIHISRWWLTCSMIATVTTQLVINQGQLSLKTWYRTQQWPQFLKLHIKWATKETQCYKTNQLKCWNQDHHSRFQLTTKETAVFTTILLFTP